MATKIQLRRDTAANWTSTNPVLSAGEIGVELDTLRLKCGDGTTAWVSLAYTTSGGTGSVGGVTVSGTASAGQTLVASSGSSASWATPSAGAISGVTVSGTPVAGQALVATSTGSAAWAAQNAATVNGVAVSGTPTVGQVLAATAPGAATWTTPSTTPGGAASGDLSGNYPAPVVAKVQGVAVSGTAPTLGQVLTATSPTAAAWTTPSSTLPNLTTPTAAVTAAIGDVASCDATGAGFTVTLPALPATGATVTVRKSDATANVVTVAPSGGGTINGDPNATITAKGAGGTFMHTATNAWIITATIAV